jgi:hypothetical protein
VLHETFKKSQKRMINVRMLLVLVLVLVLGPAKFRSHT